MILETDEKEEVHKLTAYYPNPKLYLGLVIAVKGKSTKVNLEQ